MVKRAEGTNLGGVATPKEGPAPASAEAAYKTALTQIIHRIEMEIPAEIQAAEARLAEARDTLSTAAARVEERRHIRQGRLAEGEDVTALTQEIAKIQADRDLADDLVQGLEAKRAALRREELRLQREEKTRLQKELLELSLQPIVDEYNAAAERLAAVTEALYRTANACGMSLGPCSVSTVWPSQNDWAALRVIPRLCRPGATVEHAFDYTAFAYKVQQELKAAESA